MSTDEILDALVRAWNAADSAEYGRAFAEDAVFVDVLGRVQRGRSTIATEHQKLFDTIYRGSTLRLERLDSTELGPDLELLHTATVLTVPEGPRAGDTPAVQTKLIRDGAIIAFHNSIVADGPAFAGHDSDLADRAPLGWDR